MPLNPPSYKGFDVYYSTNVFVNKVPVALWEAPAGAFNDGTPATATTTGGDQIFNNNEAGSKAYKKYLQSTQGGENVVDDDGTASYSPESNAKTQPPVTGTPKTPTGPDANPSAPAQPVAPGNYELNTSNLPDKFPPNLHDTIYGRQISKYFKLGDIRNVPIAQAGFSAKQIATNFINLAINLLYHMYAYLKFNINSAFRTESVNKGTAGASKTSHHLIGAAADCRPGPQGPGGKAAAITLFKWVLQSNLPFGQIIFEQSAGTGTCWVHVSYGYGVSSNRRVSYCLNAATSSPNYIPCGQNGENCPSWLK